MQELATYLVKIRDQGYRVTPQRELIFMILQQSETHATAVSIYEKAKLQMPSLNQATIYRTLDFLCELNLVAKTDWKGQIVYELVGQSPHHHLICRLCDGVAPLDNHHFIQLVEHIRKEHDFLVEISHLALTGLCADCQ